MKLFILMIILSFNSYAQVKSVKLLKCIDETEGDHRLSINFLNGIKTQELKITNTTLDNGREVIAVLDRFKNIVKDKESKNIPLANIPVNNICFTHVYNTYYGLASDVVETMYQKMIEANSEFGIDVNDALISSVYFSTVYKYKTSVISKLAELLRVQGVEPANIDNFANKIVNDVDASLSLVEIMQVHNETIDRIESETKGLISNGAPPMVLVSHSQGNLFANELVQRLQNSEPEFKNFVASKFANLQIASPAGIVKAPIYDNYTHYEDKVIVSWGVRDLLGFDILDPNVRYFRRVEDYDGFLQHGVVEIYTNPETYGYLFDPNNVAEKDLVENITYPFEGNREIFEVNGVSAQVSGDDRLKRMSDIFYEKLNNLAKQVYPFGSCSSSSWDNLKDLGLDIEFHRDINGNITSYGVFRMVNGQKSYEDIYKSAFLLSVQYKKPFSSVIYSAELGKPGEILSSEQSDILSRANWLYLSYAGNYSYAEDTVTPIQNNCKIFPYRISDLDINVGLLEYGLISTIRINKGSDYTSIKVFESETDDNASPIGVPVELFSWRNDLELPPVIQNGTYEYSFQVQSKINKTVIVEKCKYFNCSSNRANVSLPKIVVHKSIHDDAGGMSPGVDILNSPPVRPQVDFTYNYSFGDSGDVSFILRGMGAPYGGTIYNWYTTYTCGFYDEAYNGWSGYSYIIPWRASQETELLSGGNLNSDGYISNIEREVIVDIFYPESENVSIEPMQFTFSESSCSQ